MFVSKTKRGALPARYGIIIIHSIFTIVTFVSYLLLTRDPVMCFVFGVSVLAWIIYVPATIAITARDSNSAFSCAGGEVAYVVVQWIIYAGAAVYLTIFGPASGTCIRFRDSTFDYISSYTYTWQPDPSNPTKQTLVAIPVYSNSDLLSKACNALLAYAIVCYVHFLITFGWMFWLVISTHSLASAKKANRSVSSIYRIVAHRVLMGRYDIRQSEMDRIEIAMSEEQRREHEEMRLRSAGTGLWSGEGVAIGSGLHPSTAGQPKLERQGSEVTATTICSVEKEKEVDAGKKSKKEERDPEWQV